MKFLFFLSIIYTLEVFLLGGVQILKSPFLILKLSADLDTQNLFFLAFVILWNNRHQLEDF